ncbi:DUF4261 domain-containing protein [Pelagicoccus sp. NFK12]|uniref:DUF4261 domain-containing protein n=1 Tax=Pelagicoccus enzymogenes TaxID=2773457 RepID=A0A927FC01_9BACT|nr:DUF4261 domain-containing protein [Pelagicoccus enzymogenes]MBD5782327.1 DUF4261 domain-containing protein [Pelagicoccus enzymogenes]
MSFFGFFSEARGKKAPQIEPVRNHLAFVLLEEPSLPSAEALARAFAKYHCGQGELVVEASGEGNQKIITVSLPKLGTAFIALVDAKVPNNEAENHCDYSLESLSSPQASIEHRAHLMVTSLGTLEGTTPLEGIDAFTSLLAGIVESSSATGVYWGNSRATHSREFFLSLAGDCSVMPRVILWNGFSRGRENKHSMSFLSMGMNQLGLPELYLVFPQDETSVAVERFFDLLSYVAQRGEAIPAGDTIGASESQRIPVRYVKSPAGDKTTVWKIDLRKG